MISEEMLSCAAGEVAEVMVASAAEIPHTFSPGFEKKLDTLIHRSEHPVRQQVLRYAAAVLIAVLTAFGSLYLLSPTVRATVNGWVRSTFGKSIEYHSSQTKPSNSEYDYRLPEQFEDYKLIDIIQESNCMRYVYLDSENNLLFFDFMYGAEGKSMFILDVEDSLYHTGTIGPFFAEIYIDPKPNCASTIVWINSEDNILFSIQAIADADQLIAYAALVERVERIE